MPRNITRDFDLLFDGELRAYTKEIDGVDVKFIGGTASSTARDLYGSVIGPECQVKMLEKLRTLASKMGDQKSGLTAWLNHSYKIPEDCLGAFVGASLATRTDDDGVDYIDLDIECRVTETNPRAVAAWQQVKDGIRHGWSIGAIFLDIEWDDPEDWFNMDCTVLDIDLLEISLVGIPANQRAWCREVADLKARALATAEAIVREAQTAPEKVCELFDVDEKQMKRPEVRRSLVRRSMLHEVDGVADSASTSPLFARETPVPSAETVTEAPPTVAEDVPAVEAEQCSYVHGCGELRAADSMLCAAHRELALLEQPNTDQPSQRIMSWHWATFTQHMTADGAFDYIELSLDENGKAVISQADLIGLFQRNLDLIEKAIGEPCELAAALNERAADADAAFGEDARSLMQQAAEAVKTFSTIIAVQHQLGKRDPMAGEEQPVAVDCLSAAISHAARAVGHGLCIRDAKHIGNTIDCIASAIGNVVDQPGPTGEPDPGEALSFQIEKLEPKAGDVLVIHGVPVERVKDANDSIHEIVASLGIKVLFVTDELDFAMIDGDLAAKAAELEALDAAIVKAQSDVADAQTSLTLAQEQATTSQAQLTELVTELETKQSELTDLNKKIDTAKATRLGRKDDANGNISAAILKERDTLVLPEYYAADGDAAIKRMLARGNSESENKDDVALSGRDFAIGLKPAK